MGLSWPLLDSHFRNFPDSVIEKIFDFLLWHYSNTTECKSSFQRLIWHSHVRGICTFIVLCIIINDHTQMSITLTQSIFKLYQTYFCLHQENAIHLYFSFICHDTSLQLTVRKTRPPLVTVAMTDKQCRSHTTHVLTQWKIHRRSKRKLTTHRQRKSRLLLIWNKVSGPSAFKLCNF